MITEVHVREDTNHSFNFLTISAMTSSISRSFIFLKGRGMFCISNNANIGDIKALLRINIVVIDSCRIGATGKEGSATMEVTQKFYIFFDFSQVHQSSFVNLNSSDLEC